MEEIENIISQSTKKILHNYCFEKINIPIIENQFIFHLYSNGCDSIHDYSKQCIQNLKDVEEIILHFSFCRIQSENNLNTFLNIFSDFTIDSTQCIKLDESELITLNYENKEQTPFWILFDTFESPNILIYDTSLRYFFMENLQNSNFIIEKLMHTMKELILLHGIASVYEKYLTKLYEKYKFQLSFIHGEYFDIFYSNLNLKIENNVLEEGEIIDDDIEEDNIDSLNYSTTYIKKSVINNF